MRTLILFLIQVFAMQVMQAQNSRMARISFGTDGIILQADFNAFKKLNYTTEFGIVAKGIDIKLNDFIIGVGCNYELANNLKNNLRVGFTTGVTFVQHELFSNSVYYITPQLKYSRFMGAKKKHGVSVNVGYKFGSTSYKLSNTNSYFSTEMIQSYKLQPLIFNLGYCIRF